VGSALRALVAWPMFVLGLYMIAAVVGSLIPVNAEWKPPEKGYEVYIYDNGVHTSLIFPRKIENEDYDLGLHVTDPPIMALDQRGLFQLPDSRFPGDIAQYPYIMVGWGDARFYRETPTWGHVRPSTAVAALFGSGEALLHVDRLRHIPYRNVKRLVLREREYGSLYNSVLGSFMGVVEWGYGPDDRFYLISPGFDIHRYSALFTCNNWVSEALKTAGVKTGTWTPLPFGVMWWHEDASVDTREKQPIP
jgi:uncharacterized protein (TIGR02117 family)